jgi:hypothetical protein
VGILRIVRCFHKNDDYDDDDDDDELVAGELLVM